MFIWPLWRNTPYTPHVATVRSANASQAILGWDWLSGGIGRSSVGGYEGDAGVAQSLFIDGAADGQCAFCQAHEAAAEEVECEADDSELEGGPLMGDRFNGIAVRAVAGVSLGGAG